MLPGTTQYTTVSFIEEQTKRGPKKKRKREDSGYQGSPPAFKEESWKPRAKEKPELHGTEWHMRQVHHGKIKSITN